MAEQYLWDQLSKNTVGTVEDILQQCEQHTQQDITHSHNEQVNKGTPEYSTHDTQQNNIQDNTSRNSSPNQTAVNRKTIQITCHFTFTEMNQMGTLSHAQNMEE